MTYFIRGVVGVTVALTAVACGGKVDNEGLFGLVPGEREEGAGELTDGEMDPGSMPGSHPDSSGMIAGPGLYPANPPDISASENDAVVFSALYYNGSLYQTLGEHLFVAGLQYFPESIGYAPDPNDHEAFVARINQEHQVEELRQLPGLSQPQMLTGQNGTLAITGQLYGDPLTFDGFTLDPADGDSYVLWLNSKLEVIDSAVFGGAVFANDGDMNSLGELVISSSVYDETESANVAKFDAQGELVWQRSYAGTGSTAWADKVAFAADGNIVMVGAFNSTFMLDQLYTTHRDHYEGFVAVLDGNNGDVLRSTTLGGAGYEYVRELNVLAGGTIPYWGAS